MCLLKMTKRQSNPPAPAEKECAKITSKHVENINSTNNQRILNNSVRIFSVCVCCYFHCNSQYCHKHMETTAPHLSRNVIHLESVDRQFWEIVSALWEEEYSSGDSFGTIDIKPLKFIPFERTSLVVQWLRICLPVQGTWVQSLVRELRSHMPRGN